MSDIPGNIGPGSGKRPSRPELIAIAVLAILAAVAQMSSRPARIEAAGGRAEALPEQR